MLEGAIDVRRGELVRRWHEDGEVAGARAMGETIDCRCIDKGEEERVDADAKGE